VASYAEADGTANDFPVSDAESYLTTRVIHADREYLDHLCRRLTGTWHLLLRQTVCFLPQYLAQPDDSKMKRLR
jgi:hypothetical protein